MKDSTAAKNLVNVWHLTSEKDLRPSLLLYLCLWGFAIGLAVGAVISIFRILSNKFYNFILHFSSQPDHNFGTVMLILIICLLAALITGLLIRNPAIRFGGASWELSAIADGQVHPWRKILIPKFIGSCLVIGLGVSVGREGPCIQMGAATAMGLDTAQQSTPIKRRFFVLGGCSAGLGGAFSAPFTGIAYVYEVMKQKMDPILFIFLLAGSLGVYVSEIQLFGLGVMLPFPSPSSISFLQSLWLLPLGVISGFAGILYSYTLHYSIKLYAKQKLLSPSLRPIIVFLATAFMLFIFPALTGEGLAIFSSIQSGKVLLSYLCFFFCAKLLFTAFCYGSGIPAGVMVPLLCVGGVCGGIYADLLLAIGAISPEMVNAIIVMGMAGAFASGERAPITGLLLVLEMTAVWSCAPAMLLVVAISAYCGRILNIEPI